VSRFSKNQDAAIELVRYLTSAGVGVQRDSTRTSRRSEGRPDKQCKTNLYLKPRSRTSRVTRLTVLGPSTHRARRSSTRPNQISTPGREERPAGVEQRLNHCCDRTQPDSPARTGSRDPVPRSWQDDERDLSTTKRRPPPGGAGLCACNESTPRLAMLPALTLPDVVAHPLPRPSRQLHEPPVLGDRGTESSPRTTATSPDTIFWDSVVVTVVYGRHCLHRPVYMVIALAVNSGVPGRSGCGR
jgi:hypothetical protein